MFSIIGLIVLIYLFADKIFVINFKKIRKRYNQVSHLFGKASEDAIREIEEGKNKD